MTVTIALLRGINILGSRQIRMETFQAILESLGMRDVQTYIRSGNAVFRAPEKGLAKLGPRIESAIERECGFRCAVILRTRDELRRAMERNPLAGFAEEAPASFLVSFLSAAPTPEACEAVNAMKIHPEVLRVEGAEAYIYFPDGIGRSKLNLAAIDKALKVTTTARNWNTVRKLLEMAESLAAASGSRASKRE